MFRYQTPPDPQRAGYAIVGDRFALLVAGGIDERVLAGLWDTAADERSLLEDVLSVLVAGGIHTLPDFALAEFAPGFPARVRVAVRGAATVETTAGRAVEGRDARTWTETSLDDVEGLRMRVGDDTVGSPLPLGLGVVRADELAWGKPAAAASGAAPSTTGSPADAAPVAQTPDAAPQKRARIRNVAPAEPASTQPAPAEPAPQLPRIPAPTADAAASLDENDVLETLFIDRSLFARPIDDEQLELPAFLTDETGEVEIQSGSELPDERTLLGGRRASAAPTPSATYVLRVTPGRDLPLDRPVVLGRGPRPARHPGSRIEAVPSPAKEISGAHLEVRLDGDHLVAHDLDSTNGTIVRPRGGEPLLLRGGASLRVPVDTLFDLGDGVTARFQTESAASRVGNPQDDRLS